MGKLFYKVIFALYGAAIVVCGAIRVLIKLRLTDYETGLPSPQAGSIGLTFTLLLAFFLVVWFLASTLRKELHDYPIDNRRGLVSFLMVLCGLGAFAYSILGLPQDVLQVGSSEFWVGVFRGANLVLGLLSGAAFLQAGWSGLMRPARQPAALLGVFPAVWLLVLLISRFNNFNAPLFIYDNMLNILFMGFGAIFCLGQARLLSGYGRHKNGRNYSIPSGLATSLCGFLLVIPSYLAAVFHKLPLAASGMTLPESIFVLLLSLYALCFTASFCRSIKYV